MTVLDAGELRTLTDAQLSDAFHAELLDYAALDAECTRRDRRDRARAAARRRQAEWEAAAYAQYLAADAYCRGNMLSAAGKRVGRDAWPMCWQGSDETASCGAVHGHTGPVLAKVRAILDGADPAGLLPAALKTGHFYRNIADPADPHPVTVDRHAHDIAAGERYGRRNRGLTCPARYATLADAYRAAAAELGELPSTVQAVTWLAWRQMPA